MKTQNPVALQVQTYFQIQIPKPSMTMTPTSGLVRAHVGGAAAGEGAQERRNVRPHRPERRLVVSGLHGDRDDGHESGLREPARRRLPLKIHSCYSSPAPCPGPGYMYKLIPGYMKYTRTGKMLGGPANGKLTVPPNVVIGATGGGAFVVPLRSSSRQIRRSAARSGSSSSRTPARGRSS